MKEEWIRDYIHLLVQEGIAVQPGQEVVIVANVGIEKEVAMAVEECYQAGAKYVYVDWRSEAVNRVELQCGSEEVLSQVSPMAYALAKWKADDLPSLLWLSSDDPDAAKGTDPLKTARIAQKQYQQIGAFKKATNNKITWCIAGIPSVKWAKKIFPDLSPDDAVEALWKAILKTSRAEEGRGVENWKKHDEELKKRCEFLNGLRLKSLHYRSQNGTDLTVGLIPGVRFLGGGEATIDGRYFEPNIPSEEVFTSPRRGEAEGIVYATKPLIYKGTMIRDFWVRFHEGKAVDVHAEEGEDALRSILTLDEGSAYLGECALVPYDSPINNTGLLFYKTLFDENAACHLALGMGFTELYPDFEKYTDEQIHSFGVNDSLSHVDFMIGSADLSIVGTKENGETIEIFHHGNWNF